MSHSKRINVNEHKIIHKLYLREIKLTQSEIQHEKFMIKKYSHDEIINACIKCKITFNGKHNYSILDQIMTYSNYITKLFLGDRKIV